MTLLPKLAAGLLVLMPWAASASDTLVGVGITNISWQKPAAISQTLDAIDAAGFQAVRIAWKGNMASARLALREASDDGLSILVVLPLTDGPVSQDGASARPVTGEFFAVNGLSQLDLTKFTRQVDDLLDFIASGDINVAGIEVGNEMNWAAFNGDLPLAPQGQVVRDLAQLAPDARSRFEAGMASYADAIATLQHALLQRGLDGQIAVVSGALANIDEGFVVDSGATLVSADIARDLLTSHGAFASADAVGIHLYEPLQLRTPATARTGKIAAALDACDTPALGGHPCWITEYGIAQWQAKCDIADTDRRAAISALTRYLAEPENAGRVQATFFYDWADSQTYSLVRCGHLSALAADLTAGLQQ